MRKATKLLAAAVIAGGVVMGLLGSRLPWHVGPGLALGADIVSTMPPEAVGFNGTLSGQVAKPGGQGWFVIKVVKVIGLAPNNRTRLNAKALTAAWKDKYVTIVGKNLPPVAVGDMVTVVGTQFEMHIRSSKVTKQDGGRPGGHAQARRGRPELRPRIFHVFRPEDGLPRDDRRRPGQRLSRRVHVGRGVSDHQGRL